MSKSNNKDYILINKNKQCKDLVFILFTIFALLALILGYTSGYNYYKYTSMSDCDDISTICTAKMINNTCYLFLKNHNDTYSCSEAKNECTLFGEIDTKCYKNISSNCLSTVCDINDSSLKWILAIVAVLVLVLFCGYALGFFIFSIDSIILTDTSFEEKLSGDKKINYEKILQGAKSGVLESKYIDKN